MKMTLLEMVQNILAALTSDEVNDIDDTVESNQVVEIIKTSFLDMVSNRNWAGQRRLLQITPSGDSTIPTHMTLVEPIKEMCFVNYNKTKPTDNGRIIFEKVKYLEPEAFLRTLNARNNLDSNITTVIDPYSLVPLLIHNDIAPTYYTSFDDTTLIFDAWESQLENTLQASKIQAVAYLMPVFQYDNNWIPELPDEAFLALTENAKSRAFLELKQQENPKAEQTFKKQQSWLSRKNWRAAGGVQYPNYGRQSKIGFFAYPNPRDPTFRRDN